MRSKVLTGFLALFFGIFGVHRFYLGQRPVGIVYFILAVASIFVTALTDLPFVLLPALMGFLDAIIFLAMPRAEFDKKYNNRVEDPYYTAPPFKRKNKAPDSFQHYKTSGIDHFRSYRFEEAAEDFERALEIKPEDTAVHFNLACTFSILEDAEAAFFHLEQAVDFGFNKFDKIYNHEGLAFLRAQDEFDDFVENNYRRPPARLHAPMEEEFVLESSQVRTPSDSVLDQIIELGKLRDNGILTNEEFAKQKQKLLENG